MARDYYPVVARAIAHLPDKSGKSRQIVYEHARTVLVRKMRETGSALLTTLRELDALKDAISKVEGEVTCNQLAFSTEPL